RGGAKSTGEGRLFVWGTSAQVMVALGVGAEGALHARAPRKRNSEARSWLGQAHVPVACFGVPSRVGAPSPDPQRHAPGCAEVPRGSGVFAPWRARTVLSRPCASEPVARSLRAIR